MMQKFVDYIIRPKRKKYSLTADLGSGIFVIDDKFCCERLDFEVKNSRGLTLKCSLFHRSIDQDRQYPMIVYCHGNSGNRTESYDAVCCMLRMNILVLSFDFAGCGLSDGNCISLGYNEQKDIEDVLNHVKNTYDFVDQKRIGLWGRSMGAVASLLFAASRPNICLLVLDSPFSDLSMLLKENIDKYKLFSKIAGNYIYTTLRNKVLTQAKFNIEDVSPISVINKCGSSILLIHGNQDTIVPIHHSKDLFKTFNGDKAYIEVDMGHNETRPDSALEKISDFIIEKFTSPKRKPLAKTYTIKIAELTQPNITINTFGNLGDRPDSALANQRNMPFKEDFNTNDEMDDGIQVQSSPFVRQNKRHLGFYKPKSSAEEEEDSPKEESSPDIFKNRSLMKKESVELTRLLASKRTINDAVILVTRTNNTFVVKKSDMEQVESMVNILEEFKEDELQKEKDVSCSMEIGEENEFEKESSIHAFEESQENLATEESKDVPCTFQKDSLAHYIPSASGDKFEKCSVARTLFSGTDFKSPKALS